MADRFCTNCGQELGQDDKFCTNCGTPMREAGAAAPPQTQQPQQPRHGLTVGRVLLLVFVVPVLLAVAWFVFQFATGFLEGLFSG
jgi:uncharacterized membrane protein YvbJ